MLLKGFYYLKRIRRRMFHSVPYGRCFISHSYQDNRELDLLLDCLPKEVNPEIFPPIIVQPGEMVSSSLLETIRRCQSLVYIRDGFSAESGWVTLERDYALRHGLDVYSFNSQTRRITYEFSRPADLPVFIIYSRKDTDEVVRLMNFLQVDRSFNTSFSWENPDEMSHQTRKHIHSRVKNGGYLILCWSQNASQSAAVKRDLSEALKQYPDRIMPVLLEPADLPPELGNCVSVELFCDDGHGIDRRMLDTLVVRLYWLIYRRSNKSLL